MRRRLLIILIVALLSSWIARAEFAAGSPAPARDAQSSGWVRTADGWEPREALSVRRRTKPLNLHPGLVAAFQLGASLMVLLAFPGSAVPLSSPASAPSRSRSAATR